MQLTLLQQPSNSKAADGIVIRINPKAIGKSSEAAGGVARKPKASW
jgi:hypothetical protein